MVLNTTEEVVSALDIVKKTGCKFAIRTSGHNPNVGFSSVDDSGVVLDLRGLNSKTLDSENVLHAGGGSVWGDIYPFLEEHGRSPIGGRESQVGLGGFLTGGTLVAHHHHRTQRMTILTGISSPSQAAIPLSPASMELAQTV